MTSLSCIIRWFSSKTVREACAVRKHYGRLLAAKRDILAPQAVANVQTALDALTSAISTGANAGAIRIKAEELQFAAEKWIKPYPNAAWRENVEVLLVALAVAMGIRTFFLQPFKIPTGSMQPTLFGVTSVPDFTKINWWNENRTQVQSQINEQIAARDAIVFPTGWQRIKEWFAGNTYLHVIAQNDGELQAIEPPVRFLIFNIKQTILIGGVPQTLWFPPDFGEAPLQNRAMLRVHSDYQEGVECKKGEDLIKMEVSAGDHLFVDRLSYNFRKPKRGEIVVFATKGTAIDKQDEFYIKRLTVLPGERVQIMDDRHLLLNGQRLDASTPHFENVLGFNPDTPPHESQFSGYVNGTVARQFDLYPNLAPLFPDQNTVYTNGPDSYMVFGDNTCNSSDSRTWGTFPAENIIGKSFFVYWPLTKRFGWGNE